MNLSLARPTASNAGPHPCLLIPEIISLICEAVQALGTERSLQSWHGFISIMPTSSSARGDLASIAQTCRAFHEPANDYLWSELDVFAPLVKCMPRDLWKEERRRTGPFLVFCRPIVPSDFLNFMEKSRRVKKLLLYRDPKYIGAQHNITSTPDDIYAALSAAAGSLTLLPNLTSLALLEPTSPSIYSFLGPKLAEFCLFIFLQDAHGGNNHRTFIASLPKRYPALQSLTILDAPSRLISDALLGLPQLHTLHIPRLSLESYALAHVVHLPRLLSLSFKSEKPLTSPGSASNLPVFEVLQDLTHESNSAEDTIQLLQSASRCPLERVQIIHGAIWTSNPMWRRLFQTLSTHVSNFSLTDVHVESRARSPQDPASQENVNLSIGDIRPLFVFSNLSRLSLVIPLGLDIDDDGMQELVEAFPRLKMLNLASALPMFNSRITLRGIAAIARHCPEIARLHIRADLSKNIEDFRSQPWVVNDNLVSLDIPCPWSYDQSNVTSAISYLFPSLNEIKHAPGTLKASSRVLR